LITSSNLVGLYRQIRDRRRLGNRRQHQLRQSIFALNEELNLTVYDAGLARRLEAAFEQDLSYSKKITYEEWNSRGIGE
jgi:hypothetical protein